MISTLIYIESYLQFQNGHSSVSLFQKILVNMAKIKVDNKQADEQVDIQRSGSIPRNACVVCETQLCVTTKKVWLPDRQTHGQTDGQEDPRQSDPYVPLCFAGDTKSNIRIFDPGTCFISEVKTMK